MSTLSGEITVESPIERLGLSARGYNALLRNRVETVGQLLQKKEILAHIPGLGVKCITEIESMVENLNLDVPELSEDDNIKYMSVDIDDVSTKQIIFTSFLDLLKQLTNEYLSGSRTKSENFESIVVYRLYKTHPHGKGYTLQEIGEMFGITRERVRQLTQQFEDWLHYYIERKTDLSSRLNKFRELADTSPVIKQSHIFASIKTAFPEFQNEESPAFLKFLENLGFVSDITDAILASHPVYSFTLSLKQASFLYREARDVVNEAPITIKNLHKRIGSEYSIEAVNDLLSLNQQFIVVSGKVYRKQNDDRPLSLPDMLTIVFEKEQRALHFREAAAILRDVLDVNVTDNNVHNTLDRIDRFVWVGQGTFTLANEKTIAGKTEDLIEQYLEKRKEPARFREICDFIHSHRDLTDGAIRLAISRSPRIIQIRVGNYALKEWGGKAVKVNRRKYSVKLSDGIYKVLSEASQPLSVDDIAERLYDIYHDQCSTNHKSIRLELTIGKHSKEIHQTLDEHYLFSHKLP